ncbi:hypothetical protein C4553_03180 [Candidatus Parcubacteria bacterium]|nr:MAG: hypothetical protein C4553_03180 [Candidatus Parcubacteria bacterium]
MIWFKKIIIVNLIISLVGFGLFYISEKTAAQTGGLTQSEIQQLQQIIADPTNQQLLSQNPQLLFQKLLSDPNTQALTIKLFLPSSTQAALPGTSSFDIQSLLNPFSTTSTSSLPTLQSGSSISSLGSLFNFQDLINQFPQLKQYEQFLQLPLSQLDQLGLPPASQIQQLIEGVAGGNQIVLEVTTPTPVPSQKVRAFADVPGSDPRQIIFRWSVDNTLILSGLGEQIFEFSAKEIPGQSSVLRVSATLPSGTILNASQTIRVGDAIVTFLAESLTPPQYKGLGLPIFDASVAVSAIPLLPFSVPSSQINYEWSTNGRVVQTGSNNKFVFKTSRAAGTNELVSVKITNRTKTVSIERTVSVPITNPQVLVYQDPKSLVLVDDRGLQGGQSLMLTALPYFFSKRPESLSYKWQFMNNEVVGSGQKPNVLEATAPQQDLAGGQFQGNLNLSVENPGKIFERAQLILPLTIQ